MPGIEMAAPERTETDAFHEGLDAPPSQFRKAVHPGAGNRLHRGRGLKLVDGAVGIHDDEVEAVARLAVPRSERRDQIAGNRTIVEGRELERGEPRLEWRPICIGQAFHHRLDARHDPAQQVRSLRHAVGPKTVRPGSRDDIVQRIVGNLAGDPLRLEIGRGNSGPVGVVPRSLKEGEVVFDLVIGRQRFRNPVRRQQLVIAQFGNDLLLERHRQCLSSESLDLIRSTRTAARHSR